MSQWSLLSHYQAAEVEHLEAPAVTLLLEWKFAAKLRNCLCVISNTSLLNI